MESIWRYPLKKKAPKKLREKTERKKINLLIKIFPLKVIYQEEKGENEKKKVRVGLGKEGKGLAHNRKKSHQDQEGKGNLGQENQVGKR